MSGLYQTENIGTVLSLINLIRAAGFNLPDDRLTEGFKNVLKNTGLRGRWETLSEQPRIICDTGHNEGGIRFVVEQLKQQSYETLHIVIGMVSDKDVSAVMSLLPKQAVYYFTRAAIPRAMPEEKLATIANGYGLTGHTYPSVSAALKTAKKNCRPNDLIFVGGSTFIVAEAI